MKFLFVAIGLFIFLTNLKAQNTQEKGTVFLGGGICKLWTFNSTFNFNHSTKTNSTITDDFIAPQWISKIGYVFANHFAIDLNAERFFWNYNSSFPLINDILYTRIGVFGMDKLYKTNRSVFAISFLVGLSGGPVFSKNALKNSLIQFKKNAFNGFGGTINVGVRFELYKRIYLLIEQTGGFLYQSVVGEGSDILLRQPYTGINFSFGVFIYERWTESCNTCPKW
jgi:hypothetical protein